MTLAPSLTEEEIERAVARMNDGPAPDCEASERHHPAFPCTHEVKFRIHWCGPQGSVCAQAAAYSAAAIESGNVTCDRCYRPAETCWEIYPI